MERRRAIFRGVALAGLALVLSAASVRAAEWGGFTSSEDAERAAKGAEAKAHYADDAIALLNSYLVRRRDEAMRAAIDRSEFAKIDKEVAETNRKLAALKAERRTALQEMAEGLFCSGCNRTRSDILSKGEQFPHPGQKIIKATQAQINAKAAEFDRREAQLRNQLKSLADRRKKAIIQWQKRLLETQAAVNRTNDSLTNARNATERERQRIAREEQEKQEEAERQEQLTRLAELNEKLEADRQAKMRLVAAEEAKKFQDALRRWGVDPNQPNAPTPVQVEKAYSFQESLKNTWNDAPQFFSPNNAPTNSPTSPSSNNSGNTSPTTTAPANLRSLSETPEATETGEPPTESKMKQYYNKAVEFVKEQRQEVKPALIELAKKMRGSGESGSDDNHQSAWDKFSDKFRQGVDDLTKSKNDDDTKAPKFFPAVKIEIIDKIKEKLTGAATDKMKDEVMQRVYDADKNYQPINTDPELQKKEKEIVWDFSDPNVRDQTNYRSLRGLKELLKSGHKKMMDLLNLEMGTVNNDDISDPKKP
jgi:hypothetical protein